MKTNFLTNLAFATIISLGLVACNQPNSQEVISNSEKATQSETTNSNQSQVNSQSNQTTNITFFNEKGIAIKGTDPVAYFKEAKPVQGSKEFTHQWGNATWQFASAENRDLFASDPEKYAPQYAGFCAWAVSQGYTAPTEPDAWKIVDGKLYLNANQSIQRRWQKDIPGFIAKANQKWPSVLNR